MMSLISGVYDTYWESREVSFLLIGCSNAGKTSLLERLKVTAWDNYSRISEESLLQVNSDMNKSSSARTSVQLLDPHGRFHQDILLQQSHSQSCNSSVIRRTPIDPTRLSNNRNDANDVQYDLKHGKRMLPPHLIRPTIGMNLAKFRAFGFHIKVIDLGGSVAMRPVWEKHYTSASAIIFVVDVSGQSTIEQLMEARAFYRFMTDDDSSMPPILIFFNKVDLRLTDDVKATDQGDSHVAQSSLNHDLPLTNFSLLQIASIFLKPVAVTPAASWSCIQTLGLINQSQENNPCCVELLIQRTGEQNETNSFQNENFFFRNRLQASDSFYTKVALTAGSSKTGENVRLAFEWLLYRVQSIHNNT